MGIVNDSLDLNFTGPEGIYLLEHGGGERKKVMISPPKILWEGSCNYISSQSPINSVREKKKNNSKSQGGAGCL